MDVSVWLFLCYVRGGFYAAILYTYASRTGKE